MSTPVESRVRRLAARKGLQLSKSRQKSLYTDEPRYFVSDPSCHNVLLTSEYGVDLDDALELIESWSTD